MNARYIQLLLLFYIQFCFLTAGPARGRRFFFSITSRHPPLLSTGCVWRHKCPRRAERTGQRPRTAPPVPRRSPVAPPRQGPTHTSSARRQLLRARGPDLGRAHFGEALADACQAAAWFGGQFGNPCGRRRGARGAVGAWSRAAGGAVRSSGWVQRRQAGGRRSCPALGSRRCVALKRQREQRRWLARPRLRCGAGGGDGGADSSGPGGPGPKRRSRQAPAQRPEPGPSLLRPAPGTCLPGRG